MRSFKIGGIHPPGHKDASLEISRLELPMSAVVPLNQQIGAPARPVVAKGDRVERRQLVAECPGFVSANIHAPVSGVVSAVEPCIMPSGIPALSIVIEASDEDHERDSRERADYWAAIEAGEGLELLEDASALDPASLREKIRAAGIVGMGGATFPSDVKFTMRPGISPDVLIINACECEPYLRCDDALMCAFPGQIMAGVLLAMRAAGAPKAVIGIEDNKPEAAGRLRQAIPPGAPVKVEVLKTKYPQGGEKQLIEAVTGRRVASGALPISVGAVVANVATVFAVWQAVAFGMPLIERTLTITGEAVAPAERRNYLVAIGTPLDQLPLPLAADARFILGGPMMGRTAVDLRGPVMKGCSGITVLPGEPRPAVQPCMRCASCVSVCPMGLEPYLISRFGMLRMWDEARDARVADCLECGSCQYACPSSRPLLDYIRLAKQRSRK